jgi:hypothetical protein
MNNKEGRWLCFAACVAGAGLLLLCGWLVPGHLRAVDLAVLKQAGAGTPPLIDRGLARAEEGQRASAELFLQAAQKENLQGIDRLSLALRQPIAPAPRLSQIETLLNNGAADPSGASSPVTETVLRLANRDRILAFLQATPSLAARALLRSRDLTNTVLFPSSTSAAGQAFDAALAVCALLLEENCLSPGLREAILDRAVTAQGGGNPEPLEEVLMDIMSLGQRLNWLQLAAFVHNISDPGTLSLLASQVRNAGPQLPLLFVAVDFSQQPAAVAGYIGRFNQQGLSDLGASLRFGAGALEELLRRNQLIYDSNARGRVAAAAPFSYFFRAATDYALRAPWIALTVKWFFYLSAGYLLAASLHVVRTVPVLEEPLQVRGLHVFREMLFASGFLVVVLLLSEPFLAQDSQKVEFPLRLRLPGVGGVAAVAASGAKTKLMNTPSLLTLLLFFVLQGLIYVVCLVKLAEIRRQNVPSRVRLKLLENEDHLFDAGLYLGFCGTIVSLILVSLGVIQPSLMAAYSSTSFGIIFVSIFKIFHLRPVRRQLVLQSEADSLAAEAPTPARASYAATP